MTVFRIAGICGSLRKNSFNKKLLLRTQQLCSEHVKEATIEIIDWSQVPIYNQVLSVIRFFLKKKNLRINIVILNVRISNLILHNRYLISKMLSLTMMQSYFLHQVI
jgi:hypothetical protein